MPIPNPAAMEAAEATASPEHARKMLADDILNDLAVIEDRMHDVIDSADSNDSPAALQASTILVQVLDQRARILGLHGDAS